MRRSAGFAFALVCALGFEPSTHAVASGSGVSARSTASGSLAAALDTISSDEIRSDIFFIASDDLEGRDTISPGQRVAARFIRSRLERLGVAPGGPDGGYFYEYPLSTTRLRERESYTRIVNGDSKRDFELGRDVFFSASTSTDLDIEGEVIFCGKAEKNDLAARDVAGKWVMVLDDGGLIRTLERDLFEMKALGLLLVPAEDFDEKPYPEKFARSITAFSRGGARWPSRSSEKKSEATPTTLYLSRAAAAMWIPEFAGKDDKLPKSGAALPGRFAHKRVFQGDGGMVMAENVCGFFPGSDPVLSKDVIIISAHYDHVGYNGGAQIHNGADDNGSGTTGLLSLAEAMSVHGPMGRSVMLMWVSGEEKGLWGSKAWTENPYLPEGYKPWCNINIDMIGRNAPDHLMITPTAKHEKHNGLVAIAEELAPLEGFPKLPSCDAYWNRSDQINFANNLKIPVCFLFSGEHVDYHQPTDDPEKIDYDKIRRVARTVLRMVDRLQDPTVKL